MTDPLLYSAQFVTISMAVAFVPTLLFYCNIRWLLRIGPLCAVLLATAWSFYLLDNGTKQRAVIIVCVSAVAIIPLFISVLAYIFSTIGTMKPPSEIRVGGDRGPAGHSDIALDDLTDQR